MQLARPAATALLTLALLTLPACMSSEGGPRMSLDRHTYVSTSTQPKTISLIDARTGQEIWTNELPVGQRLTLQFKQGRGNDDNDLPDLLKWSITDEYANTDMRTGSLPVPPADARLIDMTLRPSPELPPTYAAAESTLPPSNPDLLAEESAQPESDAESTTDTDATTGPGPASEPADEPADDESESRDPVIDLE